MSEKTLYPNFTVSLHPMDMIRQNAQSVNDLAKWTELNYPVDAIRESGLFSSKSVQKDNYSADFHIASGIVTLVDVGCNGSGRWDLVVKVNFKVQDLYNGQMILDKNYDYESHDAISSCSTTTVTIGGVKSVTKTSEKGPSVNRAYPVIYEAFLKDLNETLKTAYWIERAENNRLFATTVPDIAAKLNAGQQDEAQAQILALLEKENINGLARVQVLQLGVSLFSQKDDYPQVKKYGDLGLQTIGKLAVGLPAHSIPYLDSLISGQTLALSLKNKDTAVLESAEKRMNYYMAVVYPKLKKADVGIDFIEMTGSDYRVPIVWVVQGFTHAAGCLSILAIYNGQYDDAITWAKKGKEIGESDPRKEYAFLAAAGADLNIALAQAKKSGGDLDKAAAPFYESIRTNLPQFAPIIEKNTRQMVEGLK